MDKKLHDALVNDRDTFLEQNSFDFMSAFQENPKLLDEARVRLDLAFNAALPTVKLQYFCEGLNAVVTALRVEGCKEVGADQWLPMCILVLVFAAPERFPSTLSYLNHFVKPITEDPRCEARLIGDQTEYTYVMVRSALVHFQKSIDDIDARDSA